MSYNNDKAAYPPAGQPYPSPPAQQYPQQPYPSPPAQQYQQYPTQPMANPGMTMAPGGMRNAKGVPFGQDGKRDWSFGLFDCFSDITTCCIACWCPCITYGQNKSRLRALNENGRPHPEGGEMIGTDCIVFGLVHACVGCGCVLEMMNRGDVQSRYSVSGNGCENFCASWCCMPCTMTQESREIEEEEKALNGGRM